MNILFIGDIVGPKAARYLIGRLPELRRIHSIDMVIANAENSAPIGAGMTVELVELLLANRVDVITSGNHTWDGDEVEQVLANPRVLRPYNFPAGIAGKGVITLSVGQELATVINLGDPSAMNRQYTPTIPADVNSIFEAWATIPRQGTVIVDLHSDSMNSKQAFAHFVDGQVAAVLGTHTHEPTLLLHILPKGTALVGDVGMTGPLGGVQGFDPKPFIDRYTGQDAGSSEYAKIVSGKIVLAAIVLTTEDGKTVSIQRIS